VIYSCPMIREVFDLLKAQLSPNDTVVVGVSGGSDSTALLHLMVRLAKTYPLTIVVAHINHGLRGKASDADERWVRKLAGQLGCECEVKKISLSKKESGLEEKGREARRAFFERCAAKRGAAAIITAHTEDDQLETMVFNFFRGSGPAGLAGMKVRSGLYLKPLLGVKKSELVSYLRRRKLSWRTDRSNTNLRFRRNLIRHKLLPVAEKINPSLRLTLLRNRTIFDELTSWLEAEAETFLEVHRRGLQYFSRAAFLALPSALRAAVLRHTYAHATGANYALSQKRLAELERLLERGVGNKRIIVAGGEFVLTGNWLSFTPFAKQPRG